MKRAALFFGILVLLASLIPLLAYRGASQRPQFVPWPAGQPCPVFALTNFLPCNQRFDEPRVWLQGRQQCVLYDVDAQQPLGYLTNGFPLALWSNQLVCAQFIPHTNHWLDAWWKVRRLLAVIPRPPISSDQFWLLDLNNSQASDLGSTMAFNRHQFELAPGNQLGLYFPTIQKNAGWLFDLQKKRTQFIELTNDFAGWWNPTQALLINPRKDLVLHTLPEQSSIPLVSAYELSHCARTNELPEILEPVVFSAWDGPKAQYYVFDNQTARDPKISPKTLLKVTPPRGKLEPVNAYPLNRTGEYWGQIDPSGRYYVSHLPSTNGHHECGLQAFDLTTGKTNELVAVDDTKSYRSIILRQKAAYFIDSENTLRKAALDGSGQTQVYPPATSRQ